MNFYTQELSDLLAKLPSPGNAELLVQLKYYIDSRTQMLQEFRDKLILADNHIKKLVSDIDFMSDE